LSEEFDEVNQALDPKQRANEIGDLLFSVVNLARWYGIESEHVLRETNARFRNRFNYIEKTARDLGQAVSSFSLSEMDALWEIAKKEAEIETD
jgi:tetrapyrrole methylase family protein / MazG family protein